MKHLALHLLNLFLTLLTYFNDVKFQTDMSGETVLTKIRLIFSEHSVQGLRKRSSLIRVYTLLKTADKFTESD